MAYQDPQFNASEIFQVGSPGAAANAISLGTATVSGAGNTFTGVAGTVANGVINLPKFKRAVKVNGIRVQCVATPAANLTGQLLHFLNGTSTFATATGIGTLGATDATILTTDTYASNGVVSGAHRFAAEGQPSTTFLATSTVSGHTLGSYALYIDTTELFS